MRITVVKLNTLKCLSIGTLKTIIFHLSQMEKLMVCMCSNIWADDNWAVMCPNFYT